MNKKECQCIRTVIMLGQILDLQKQYPDITIEMCRGDLAKIIIEAPEAEYDQLSKLLANTLLQEGITEVEAVDLVAALESGTIPEHLLCGLTAICEECKKENEMNANATQANTSNVPFDVELANNIHTLHVGLKALHVAGTLTVESARSLYRSTVAKDLPESLWVSMKETITEDGLQAWVDSGDCNKEVPSAEEMLKEAEDDMAAIMGDSKSAVEILEKLNRIKVQKLDNPAGTWYKDNEESSNQSSNSSNTFESTIKEPTMNANNTNATNEALAAELAAAKAELEALKAAAASPAAEVPVAPAPTGFFARYGGALKTAGTLLAGAAIGATARAILHKDDGVEVHAETTAAAAA